MKLKRILGTVAVLCLVVATVALADVVSQVYRQLRGEAPAAVSAQTEIAAVQSAAWDDSPINPVATNANPNVVAFGLFSDDGAVTAGVTCGLYYKDRENTYHFLGIAGVNTITGSTSQQDADGMYVGVAPVSFDTRAATHYDLRVTAVPAAGTVTVLHYPYGGGKREGE